MNKFFQGDDKKKGVLCLVLLMWLMAVAQDKGKDSGAAMPADKKAGSKMRMPMAKACARNAKAEKDCRWHMEYD